MKKILEWILGTIVGILKIFGKTAKIVLHITVTMFLIGRANEDTILRNIVLLIVYFVAFKFLSKFIKKGRRTKCPSCKKWFGEQITKKEILDSIGGYDTVTRTDYRKDRYGTIVGSTTRQEQVHTTTNYYRYHCKCKYCGYLYYYDRTSTFEG